MKKIKNIVFTAALILLMPFFVSAAERLVLVSSVTYDNGGASDALQDIALDSSGNVIAHGYTTVTSIDYFTIKYNSDLSVMLSSATRDYFNDNSDYGVGVAVNQTTDAIYVTGLGDPGGNSLYYTIYYDQNLSLLNSIDYDPMTSGSVDRGRGIAVDSNGYVIVTGDIESNVVDFGTTKYTSTLSSTATVTYDHAGGSDMGIDVAVDSNDNIYVTGTVTNSSATLSCHTIKYNEWLSVTPLGSVTIGNGTDNYEGADIAVDDSDNVYIVGKIFDGVNESFFIKKYSSDLSTELAGTTYEDLIGANNFIRGAYAEPDGKLSIVGEINNGPAFDMFLIRYSSDLTTILSSATFSSSGDYLDGAYDVAVDSNYVIVGGQFNNGSDVDYCLLKYRYDTIQAPDPSDDDESVDTGEGDAVIVGSSERKGIVNPDAGDSAEIFFTGSQAGTYTLRIFTVLGELVYEKKQESAPAGKFSWFPEGLSSGVYIAHIKGPGIDIQKKIAVLR